MADGPLATKRRLEQRRTVRRYVVGTSLGVLYWLLVFASRDLSRQYLAPPWQLVITPLELGLFALLATAVWRALLRREVLDCTEPTQNVDLTPRGGLGLR